MNSKVYDYFIDLEKESLPTDNIGNLIIDENRITELDVINTRVHECMFDNHTKFYAKSFQLPNSILSIASSRMYNQLGIPTPPEFVLRGTLPSSQKFRPFTFSQDVTNLPDFQCTIAEEIDEYWYLNECSVQNNNKWEPLYNKRLRDYYLSFMTEECFNKLISLYLIDELRTDRDRHDENLFFYREKPYGKFEGVVPIDLERAEIMEYTILDKQDFQDFIEQKYHSYSPMCKLDIKNYKTRIKDILYLIQDGVLSQNQIELLKNAVNYDLPKTMRDTCEKYHFEHCLNKAHAPIAHLWEYNHKQLDKELHA